MNDTQVKRQLSKQELETFRLKAQENLYFFAKGVLGYDWLTPHIHLPVCNMLSDFSRPKKKIILPRGWLKSTIGTISFPMWLGVRNPNVRVLLAQNTFTNATKKLSEIRGQFDGNALLRALFPDVLPGPREIWKTEAACLQRSKKHPESTFEAAGTRTAVTSRHYDCIIEDDTVAPDLSDLREENLVPTKEDIEQAIGWHRLVPPLLIDPGKSLNIVIGTRWFEKDLLSWIGEHESRSFVSYERAVRETNGVPDEHGEITYPERFDAEVLSGLQEAMGPYLYSCLYMNKPIRSDDMVFDVDGLGYYTTEPGNLMVWTTVDPAGDPDESKNKDQDYCVVMTCGKDMDTGNIYVLDYNRQRQNPSEMISTLFTHVKRFRPVSVGVESVQYQQSLMYWIKERMRSTGDFFLVEPLTHGRQAKNIRIQGLQPLVFSNKLYLRHWMSELVSEMVAFPYGAHDDLLDALSMQLRFWRMTLAKVEKKVEDEYDPFALESAVKELRGRFKKTKGSMDLMQSAKGAA